MGSPNRAQRGGNGGLFGDAQLFVEVDQNLGIGSGAEYMPLVQVELGDQFPEIRDFSVITEEDGLVLVVHRKRSPGRQIDDAQPRIAQEASCVLKDLLAVGAPVPK